MLDRAASAKGGKTTVERHGKGHMAAIGARGFEATVARHWNGDREGYLKHLRERASQAVIESFVDIEMDRRLQAGERTVCMELPCLTDPDEPW